MAASSEIVLGLGGTVDFEIDWDSSVLEALALHYEVDVSELTIDRPILSERDLLVAVLGFVQRGTGGERFVASSGIVEAFAERFRRRVTLGGTGVRAAIAMDVLGIPSTLHLVSIDDTVRRLLPASSAYVSSARADTLDPHLIIQYPVEASVRVGSTTIAATHPNRLIFSNDPPNQTLYLSAELPAALREARVLLISGFNSMQDEAELRLRLLELRDALSSLPASATVFYEDSGFHRPELSRHVREALLDRIDVYSMNEDELETHLGRSVDLLDPAAVASALAAIAEIVPARTLVIHTKYWSVARGERAEELAEALRGGVLMASTRYRFGDGFTPEDYAGVADERRNPAGAAVAQALTELDPATVCVPAFLLDDPAPTTIGLGDSFVGGFIAALMRGRAV